MWTIWMYGWYIIGGRGGGFRNSSYFCCNVLFGEFFNLPVWPMVIIWTVPGATQTQPCLLNVTPQPRVIYCERRGSRRWCWPAQEQEQLLRWQNSGLRDRSCHVTHSSRDRKFCWAMLCYDVLLNCLTWSALWPEVKRYINSFQIRLSQLKCAKQRRGISTSERRQFSPVAKPSL